MNIKNRLEKIAGKLTRPDELVIYPPPEDWPDPLPKDQIIEAAEKRAHALLKPGEQYLLVGFGKWTMRKNGTLKKRLYI